MKSRFTLLLLFGCLFLNGIGGQLVHAQHDWTWTFGDSVVMRFPNGWQNPMVSSTERSRNTFEVGACYSDSAGNLAIFATDDSIYNSFYSPVEDGMLLQINRSFTQGMLILPSPECDDSVFAFHLRQGCLNQVSCCLSFYVIDRKASGNLGKVTKTVPLGYPGLNGNGYSEKLQAVRHLDGTSWWIFLHDIHN